MFGNHSYIYIILSIICLYLKFQISFYDSRAEYKRKSRMLRIFAFSGYQYATIEVKQE